MLGAADAERTVAVSILEPGTSDAFYMSLTGQPLPKPAKRREAPVFRRK
jgi:hypothetical protein